MVSMGYPRGTSTGQWVVDGPLDISVIIASCSQSMKTLGVQELTGKVAGARYRPTEGDGHAAEG
jgi:hypothetical protein